MSGKTQPIKMRKKDPMIGRILECLLLAFLFVFIRALVCGDPVAGWPSLVCIVLFLSGVQLFCLGMVGQYLARVYPESKHRPLFICREANISEEKFVKMG